MLRVPGHEDVESNEAAGALAKEESSYAVSFVTPRSISLASEKLADIALQKMCQRPDKRYILPFSAGWPWKPPSG